MNSRDGYACEDASAAFDPHHRCTGSSSSPAEQRRLASLLLLEVLDTPREAVFDRLVSLAASTLRVPLASITFVDEDRLWFKATVGTGLSEVPRGGSCCHDVVGQASFLEVPDVLADRRYRDGPLAAAGVRWYAGAPIFGIDGLPVGTLCVLDVRPRALDQHDRHALEQIADLVTGQLHLSVRRARSRVQARADLASTDLRLAVQAGELVPHYQPIVSLEGGSLVGCEALARRQHPRRGLLAPAAFLGIAERDDVILDLDRTILAQACRQLAFWHHDSSIALKPSLSVNVSSRHLSSSRLLPHVRAALEGNGLRAESLTLELTETVLATADADAVGLLGQLRDLGVSLALDDFGTLYSSLSYLQRFPVTSLKIDRSFVSGLGAGSRDESLVEAILHLAGRLGLDTVAEGVETQAQAAVLRELGCPKAQGYLYSAPVPAPELTELLTTASNAGTTR